jgi:hypothetical protein
MVCRVRKGGPIEGGASENGSRKNAVPLDGDGGGRETHWWWFLVGYARRQTSGDWFRMGWAGGHREARRSSRLEPDVRVAPCVSSRWPPYFSLFVSNHRPAVEAGGPVTPTEVNSFGVRPKIHKFWLPSPTRRLRCRRATSAALEVLQGRRANHPTRAGHERGRRVDADKLARIEPAANLVLGHAKMERDVGNR